MEQYLVTGMSCAACSARVEKAVNAVPGVRTCAVSLLTNSMGVEGTADAQTICRAVEEAGYHAEPKEGVSPTESDAAQCSAKDPLADHESPLLLRRLLASLGFLLVLMYLSMGHTMWHWPLPGFLAQNPVSIGVLQLLLSAVILIINQKFFISGFRGLIHRAPNMDTLVALGSAASFGYSTVMLFVMSGAQQRGDSAAAMAGLHELYFESAGMILTLILVGKLLEARSKGKTTNALKSLMRLAPQTATLLRNGAEISVPVGEVMPGDEFVVRPGESIPVDGVVLEGTGAVNEAALTGESLPVDKAPKSSVSAATVNQSGFLRCRATRVGQDTTLSQIIRMVSDAAATKAPIAKVADRVSGVFVPTVIAIAAITTAVWLLAGQTAGFALARGISVLVISCPCALGLATPVAIMVGNGVGARHGILFKTAVSLEQTGKTRLVALDKTGTITSGQPRVTDLLPADDCTERELLTVAAALEQKSEHPLARAVLQAAQERNLALPSVENFAALPGHGLRASLNGQPLLGGSMRFISGQTEVPAAFFSQAEAFAGEGKTPLLFVQGGRLLGAVAVADGIKEESAQAVRELHGLGLQVCMLTGDNERTARAIARQSGVDEVIAGVLPEGKEDAVRKLQQQGSVTMVGDGINDAPALTRANTGIAIGAGTDIAIDAADVVLMHSRLTDVPAAIRLSRATLRNIHENLFWAFFYNIIGIPLAAGVWIPLFGWQLNPMFGAAAMSLSSFCVVSNALRLNWFDLFNPAHDRRRSGLSRPNPADSKSVFTQTKGHRFASASGSKNQADSVNPSAATQKETFPMQKTMNIEGMMCAHCEARVKKALESLPGVSEAVVSHETGTAVVTLSADVSNATLKQTVEAADYTVTGIQ